MKLTWPEYKDKLDPITVETVASKTTLKNKSENERQINEEEEEK